MDILNAWSTYEKYACKFARILFWNVEKKQIHQYQNFHLKFLERIETNNDKIIIDRIVDQKQQKKERKINPA